MLHRTGEDRFEAAPAPTDVPFLYGGLTLAMALTAAARTVAEGLVPMSLRCSFVSFGAWGPTTVTVDRVNTSRSFASRRVLLQQQAHGLVAAVDATFHRVEPGRDVQHAPPPPIADPEALESTPVTFGSIEPFEVRPEAGVRADSNERFHPYWSRSFAPLPEDPITHAAALAFMSDYQVIRSPFERGSGARKGLSSFTLEHTLWFHRPLDATDWLLYDCVPLTQSSGRYVSRGTVHDGRDALVASFVQEGFVRPERR